MTHPLTGLLIQVQVVFQFIFVANISLVIIYLVVSLVKSLWPRMRTAWSAMECILAINIATLSWISALTRRDQLVDYEMKRTMVSSDKD